MTVIKENLANVNFHRVYDSKEGIYVASVFSPSQSLRVILVKTNCRRAFSCAQNDTWVARIGEEKDDILNVFTLYRVVRQFYIVQTGLVIDGNPEYHVQAYLGVMPVPLFNCSRVPLHVIEEVRKKNIPFTRADEELRMRIPSLPEFPLVVFTKWYHFPEVTENFFIRVRLEVVEGRLCQTYNAFLGASFYVCLGMKVIVNSIVSYEIKGGAFDHLYITCHDDYDSLAQLLGKGLELTYDIANVSLKEIGYKRYRWGDSQRFLYVAIDDGDEKREEVLKELVRRLYTRCRELYPKTIYMEQLEALCQVHSKVLSHWERGDYVGLIHFLGRLKVRLFKASSVRFGDDLWLEHVEALKPSRKKNKKNKGFLRFECPRCGGVKKLTKGEMIYVSLIVHRCKFCDFLGGFLDPITQTNYRDKALQYTEIDFS